MDFLKKNFIQIVLFFIIVALLIQRCTAPAPKPDVINSSKIEIKHDTVYQIHDSFIVSKPKLVRSIPIIRHDTVSTVSHVNHVDTLNIGYNVDSEAPAHDSVYPVYANEFIDTLKIDTLGWVAVKDTVANSLIIGRGYNYSIKTRNVSTTYKETQTAKPKNQLYFGGGIKGNEQLLINQFELGLLLKNRKDQIFGINASLGQNGISYGVSMYYKIHF